MKTILLGAGSLGTIAGALITKNGGDVLLVDANKAHVDALNRNGATVTGLTKLNVPVKAITPDQMEGTYDLVFYLVKQTYNEPALKALAPHLHKDSIVCTLQNGVPEEEVARYVGREKVIGCAVGWGATWIGPGVSELTSDPGKMTLDLGELDGSVTERIKKVAGVLEKICPTEITTNLAGIRWAKLLINATLSGMSASLGCTFGDILDSDKALACAAFIGDETIQVAAKLGVTLEKIQGADLRVLAFKTKAEMTQRFAIYRAVFGPHKLLKASMLQDIEKGLKTEIDAINGVVSESGKKVGIATPINDKVVEIVKRIETGKMKTVFDNLSMFDLPELPEK